MDLELMNKKVLITGSSKGLGFAIAKQFALEGACVCINSRNSANLEKAKKELETLTHSRIQAISGDVSDPDVPEKLIKSASNSLNGLDILVTNTGGPKPGLFESLSEEDWQSAANLLLFSHIRLIRAALPFLYKGAQPSILAVTSYSVKQPIPNLILSNTLRSATVALIKSLSSELTPGGIRVNSILPGWTDTERVQTLMRSRAEQNQASIDVEIAKQMQESPFNRMATPDEFAKVAVFLASPAASYITGLLLSVDGGMVKGLF